MKDSKTSYWPLALIFIGILLFFSKQCAAQSGTFTKLTLKDRWGVDTLKTRSYIQLLPGKLKVSENGQEWLESILFQSKGIDTCELETQAGHYLLILEKQTIKKAYLRSNLGADRVYE